MAEVFAGTMTFISVLLLVALLAVASGATNEIAVYQDHAIKAGIAAKDDTGTFYWKVSK